MNNIILKRIAIPVACIAASAAITSCVQPATPQPNVTGAQQAPNNQYAVPGLNAQQPNQQQYQIPQNPGYQPQVTGQAPYQPLPGVPSQPIVEIPSPAAPNLTPTFQSVPSGSVYDVVRGDSLWAISRKHGVSVEALQQANGLTDTNIWAGQKLNIPAGN